MEKMGAAGNPPTVFMSVNRPGGQVQGQQGTHFFKGQVGRFRERYSVEEQKILAEKFGKVTFAHVRREHPQQRLADKLANRGVDSATQK